MQDLELQLVSAGRLFLRPEAPVVELGVHEFRRCPLPEPSSDTVFSRLGAIVDRRFLEASEFFDV